MLAKESPFVAAAGVAVVAGVLSPLWQRKMIKVELHNRVSSEEGGEGDKIQT